MSLFDDKDFCMYLQLRNMQSYQEDKVPVELMYFLKRFQMYVGEQRFNELRNEAKAIKRQRAQKTQEELTQIRNFENSKYEKITALIIAYVKNKIGNTQGEEALLRLDFINEFTRINHLSDPEVCRDLGLKIQGKSVFNVPNELSMISQHQFAASKDSQQPEVDLPNQSRHASQRQYTQSDSKMLNNSYLLSNQHQYQQMSNYVSNSGQNENKMESYSKKQYKNVSNNGTGNQNLHDTIIQLQNENAKLKSELERRKLGKPGDETEVSRQNIEQTTKLAALQSEYDQTAAKSAKLERDLAKERADNKKSKEQIQQLNRKCENIELFALEIQKHLDKYRRIDRNGFFASQKQESLTGTRNVLNYNETLQSSQIPGKRDTLRRSALFSSTSNGTVIQLSQKPEQRNEINKSLDLNEVFRELQSILEYKNLKIQYFTQTKGELRAMKNIIDDVKKQFQQLSRAFTRNLEDKFNDIMVSATMMFKKYQSGKGRSRISGFNNQSGFNMQNQCDQLDYNKLSQIRIFNNTRRNLTSYVKDEFPLVSPVMVQDSSFEVRQLGGKAKQILEKENISLFLIDLTCQQGHTVNLLKVVNPLTLPKIKILFSCCGEYGGKLYDGLRLKQQVADRRSLVQIQVQNPQEYVQFCNIVDQKIISLHQLADEWVYEIQMHVYNEELTARLKSFITQICHGSEEKCHQVLDGIVGQEGAKFILV